MTDGLSVKKPVQLSVSGVELRVSVVIRKLTQLSGLQVQRGGWLGKKLYAYFDDVESANTAANIIIGITYCKTRVHVGDFDVTNLLLDDELYKLRDLNTQSQTSHANQSSIDTTKYTMTLLPTRKAKVHHILS